MSATTKGTAHLFGASGTVSNATVLAFELDEKKALEVTTQDENGVVIERRGDDTTSTGTIKIRIRSGYTVPSSYSTVTYNAVVYLITGVKKSETNNGFREVTLSFITSESVSLA